MERKRLWINSPADRDAVTVILVRNGYTVRQGATIAPEAKLPRHPMLNIGRRRPANEC